MTYAQPSIEDYADRTAEQLKWWQAQSGQLGGDPAMLARALLAIASVEPPPRRFIAGVVDGFPASNTWGLDPEYRFECSS